MKRELLIFKIEKIELKTLEKGEKEKNWLNKLEKGEKIKDKFKDEFKDKWKGEKLEKDEKKEIYDIYETRGGGQHKKWIYWEREELEGIKIPSNAISMPYRVEIRVFFERGKTWDSRIVSREFLV